MKKRDLVFNKLILIGFVFYVLILTGERIASLILSISHVSTIPVVTPAVNSGNWFAIVTYVITCISLVAGLVLLAKPMLRLFKVMCKKEIYDFKNNSKDLIIGSMVLLVSGMMHTSYTIAGIQFAAYGFLILAIIVRGIQAIYENVNKFSVISSLIFIVSASMAIPVCYYTNLHGAKMVLFYVAEFMAVAVLIPLFTKIMLNFFKVGYHGFDIYYPMAMGVLSGLTIAMKWKEEINFFLLIFVCLTAVVYLTIGIVNFKRLKK